jgi:hypothetical protein
MASDLGDRLLSGLDVTLDLSVNGKLFDLGEKVNGEKFAAAGIKKCGSIAKLLMRLPPWAELYVAAAVAGDGPLVGCFPREQRNVAPPFVVAGEPTLKVYFYCRGGAIQMVGLLLVQGRVTGRNADVSAEWFAREALKHLGAPSFEDSTLRAWRASGRELWAKKGSDLMVRWLLRPQTKPQG